MGEQDTQREALHIAAEPAAVMRTDDARNLCQPQSLGVFFKLALLAIDSRQFLKSSSQEPQMSHCLCLSRSMSYPLGSFPRFAHQENWASERRERAIHNSIVTRKNEAHRHLEAEKKVCRLLEEIYSGLKPTCPEGEAFIRDLHNRIERIRHYHDQGMRVYYSYLGETMQKLCIHSGFPSGVNDFSKKQLEAFVMDLGGLKPKVEELRDLAVYTMKHNPPSTDTASSGIGDMVKNLLNNHFGITVSATIYILVHLIGLFYS